MIMMRTIRRFAEMAGLVSPSQGGTGLDTSAAAGGQLLIGNGAGFSLATLGHDATIAVTPGAGTLAIAVATVPAGQVSGLGTASTHAATDFLAEPTGTPTSSKFACGDGTWAVPPAGGSMAVGGAVSGATAGEILYTDVSGNLAQGSTGGASDLGILATGSVGSTTASTFLRLNSGGGVPTYFGSIVQKQCALTLNAYFDGSNWVYANTGFAGGFRLNSAGTGGDSGFQLCLIPAGTSGNTITGMDSTYVGMVGLPGNHFVLNPGTYNPAPGAVAILTINPSITTDALATVQVNAAASGNKGLVLQGAAGQTGNMLEIQDATGNLLFALAAGGSVTPASLANASAPNGSLYYSTTASKLVYKDSGGVVNPLY